MPAKKKVQVEPAVNQKKPPGHLKKYGLFYLLALAFVFYALRSLYTPYVMQFLFANPAFSAVYDFTVYHISNHTLLGMYLAALVGALFFFMFPTEVMFISYIAADTNPVLLIVVTVLGNVSGLFIDYLFGYIMGKGIWQKILKSKYHSFENKAKNYGSAIIFIFSVVPSPIDIISVVFGTLRFSAKKFLIFCLSAKLVYFITFYFAHGYITNQLLPTITQFF